ncbi:hypothetical protein [Paludibacterium sp. B53371]|uniref:hypothetical protein n=1 Tax=Paludibacterium sp. B53371 TaxID=2806263 RepID=UPI001C050392|nr:hypothetical protein [Paludibacterium sp. B53371]
MALNRPLQRELLCQLAEHYPEQVDICALNSTIISSAPDELDANLTYLYEHGLVAPAPHFESLSSTNFFTGRSVHPVTITAKGMDFLEEDGGLSAILGTVTVKLHADTIRDMLEAKIMSSTLPSPEKARFVDTLKALPSEALKTFTNKLVELACENPQAVWTTLQQIAN